VAATTVAGDLSRSARDPGPGLIRSGGRHASASLAVRTVLGWCSFLRSWLATIRSTLANHDHVCDVLINAGVNRNFWRRRRVRGRKVNPWRTNPESLLTLS
jgi:hypothetical protein